MTPVGADFRSKEKTPRPAVGFVFGFHANDARSLATCNPRPGDTGMGNNSGSLTAGRGRFVRLTGQLFKQLPEFRHVLLQMS
jgi:hypothetical protein